MSAPAAMNGDQSVKKPEVFTRFLIEQLPGQVAINAPPSPPLSVSDMRTRIADKLAACYDAPPSPPLPLSESDMGIRIADYLADHAIFRAALRKLLYDEPEALKKAINEKVNREKAAREEANRPPTPPAEQDLVTASTQSAEKPDESSTPASPSPSSTVDMKTKIRTYMAAHDAMVNPPQPGAPLNGRIPPPPFGLATVAFKPKVTLPRFETTHGFESRLRAERIASFEVRLAAIEQDMAFAAFATSTPAKKNPFGSTKSKELDSGIVSLEIPNSLATVEVKPSRPLSACSAPGAFTYKADYSLVKWSPARPLSTGVQSHFTVAHDAVALARTKSNFETSQMINPANAAGFVGNLPASLTDLQLSRELVYTFSKFGHLNVQVSRHYTAEAGKPTAILQFTHREAAYKAIKNSRDWRIGGRKLRVARSQANRSLTVWRDGVPHRAPGMPNFAWTNITNYETAEAKRQFTRFGPFDEACYVFTNWTFMRRPENDVIRLTFTNYGQFLAAKKALQAGEMLYKEKKPYGGSFYV